MGVITAIKEIAREAAREEVKQQLELKLRAEQPTPDSKEPEPSYSVAAVAAAQGVSEKTVRKWIDKGILEAKKVPGVKQYRVTRSALDKFRKAAPPGGQHLDVDRLAREIFANAVDPKRRKK